MSVFARHGEFLAQPGDVDPAVSVVGSHACPVLKLPEQRL